MKPLYLILLLLLPSSWLCAQEFVAQQSKHPVTIDGIADEIDWKTATWYPLNKHILGVMPKSSDFSGRFKLLWDQDYLYLQAEITDDILFDQHANPTHFYWDDDCLEIFIDEDRSGGNHQFNFNAFAYHIALDNQVADIGGKLSDDSPNFILLNDHLKSQWRRSENENNTLIWEVAIKIFDDKYDLTNPQNSKSRVKLTANKVMGFMLAYCDNDGSEFRESFIGSTDITPVNGDKNLGYITADVFSTLVLKGQM